MNKRDRVKRDGDSCVCSRCAKHGDPQKMLIIDDLPVCAECIYGKTKPFEIYPIGVVKNNLSRRRKSFDNVGRKGISRIELFESQKPFLSRLEEEKILTVVYYLHETKSVKSVFNRGLDGKK